MVLLKIILKSHHILKTFFTDEPCFQKGGNKKYEDDYNNCNIRYGEMKKQLAEDMIQFITPIRGKVNSI